MILPQPSTYFGAQEVLPVAKKVVSHDCIISMLYPVITRFYSVILQERWRRR